LSVLEGNQQNGTDDCKHNKHAGEHQRHDGAEILGRFVRHGALHPPDKDAESGPFVPLCNGNLLGKGLARGIEQSMDERGGSGRASAPSRSGGRWLGIDPFELRLASM
jgi:hypothetical protein